MIQQDFLSEVSEDVEYKGLKRCDTCKEHQPYTEFYNNKYKHDGSFILAPRCANVRS